MDGDYDNIVSEDKRSFEMNIQLQLASLLRLNLSTGELKDVDSSPGSIKFFCSLPSWAAKRSKKKCDRRELVFNHNDNRLMVKEVKEFIERKVFLGVMEIDLMLPVFYRDPLVKSKK